MTGPLTRPNLDLSIWSQPLRVSLLPTLPDLPSLLAMLATCPCWRCQLSAPAGDVSY